MSSNRLCTLISYCSREFLCTNDERIVVYFVFSVGRGTGPFSTAPVRSAVSIIVRVD